MFEWLKKRLSPDWERRHIVETPDGKHHYWSREMARNSQWMYAYADIPAERYTEWVYVGDDDRADDTATDRPQ